MLIGPRRSRKGDNFFQTGIFALGSAGSSRFPVLSKSRLGFRDPQGSLPLGSAGSSRRILSFLVKSRPFCYDAPWRRTWFFGVGARATRAEIGIPALPHAPQRNPGARRTPQITIVGVFPCAAFLFRRSRNCCRMEWSRAENISGLQGSAPKSISGAGSRGDSVRALRGGGRRNWRSWRTRRAGIAFWRQRREERIAVHVSPPAGPPEGRPAGRPGLPRTFRRVPASSPARAKIPHPQCIVL